MIENPIRISNGESRYRGTIGDEAIAEIIRLTGGNPCYLMKFCNALVDYMQKSNECYVSKSIVSRVANGYVFSMVNNPIEKKDFDPLFNEYSYDYTDSDDTLDDAAQEEADIAYSILKEIAELSDDRGIYKYSNQFFNNPKYYKKMKSLIERGVLVGKNGEDLSDRTNPLKESLRFNVDLFRIWLRQRG
jgi:hypothetical protein